jgi:hypothetical protein
MDEELKIKLSIAFLEFCKSNAIDIAVAQKALTKEYLWFFWVCFTVASSSALGFVISWVWHPPKNRTNTNDACLIIFGAILFFSGLGCLVNLDYSNDAIFNLPRALK